MDGRRDDPTPEERRAVAGVHTLEDLVRRPDLVIVDVIAQDEYTQDVVVVRASRFLVFDTT